MIYEVNSNDPKEGILMSDKNNNVMMNNDINNNMNNDNDPKERMRKKVKKSSPVLLFVQYLPADFPAGSFEGINTLTGWNSSTVKLHPIKKIQHFFRQNQRRRVPIRNQMTKRKAKMTLNQRQKEVWMSLISQQKE